MSSYRRIYGMVVAALILEIISPIPLFLSFGTIYILSTKPAWFLHFVMRLYNKE